MYVIEAIIGREKTLRENVGKYRNARVIPLSQGLALIPIVDELVEEIGSNDGECPEGFSKLSLCIRKWAEHFAKHGTVAYVEAEFFGGVGTQSAIAWHEGRQALQVRFAQDAINQALKLMGVTIMEPATDEFDSIGLGSHRSTERWLEGDD